MTITENRQGEGQAQTHHGLPDDTTLEGFRRRAAVADERNEYFTEDLEILRAHGYLAAAVPEAFGGWGLDLASLAALQRRLAHYAPATALGMAMHHYWVGIAVELERAGDSRCRWILEEAARGTVFAAGHAEPGNDIPVLLSTSAAERVDGGYRFRGRKMFGSNGPVWSYLGVHALDASGPDGPVVVHGFVPRGAPGVTIKETWNTLGMRPTQSHDTILEDVFVPDDRIGAVVPAGSDQHLFVLAMDIWALPLITNVYLGIAERAISLAVADARSKRSMAIPRGHYAYNPMVQHQVAAMYLALDAATATVERLVDDWQSGVDHGSMFGAKLASAKWRGVEAAKEIVDRALDVTGGAGMFRGNELERLYRDVRCGGFHPTNDALTHEMVGKAVLGIAEEEPRW
jgi:alkylation response protein AidB-like acyl-CoA dehydrogenase